MLMYFKIYFIIHSTYLRYLSENKIEALPDKIFKGLKNLKALWVQLITYKKNYTIFEVMEWTWSKRSKSDILVQKFNMM